MIDIFFSWIWINAMLIPLRCKLEALADFLLSDLQCQSQLRTLYAEGINGCHIEFSAYNLLCVMLHSNNNKDLLSAMSRLVSCTGQSCLHSFYFFVILFCEIPHPAIAAFEVVVCWHQVCHLQRQIMLLICGWLDQA